jgi:hypothetical protein
MLESEADYRGFQLDVTYSCLPLVIPYHLPIIAGVLMIGPQD